MFNPDLKKLLKNCSSRYSLVVGVAERARQIRDDAVENDVLLDEKTVSTAINEIYNGKYVVVEPDEIKSDEEIKREEEEKAAREKEVEALLRLLPRQMKKFLPNRRITAPRNNESLNCNGCG